MATPKLRFACIFSFILVGAGCSVLPQAEDSIRPARSLPKTTPWDLKALSAAPGYEWSTQDGPVWSLFYEGEAYQGKPTRVFAYYASPATLADFRAITTQPVTEVSLSPHLTL